MLRQARERAQVPDSRWWERLTSDRQNLDLVYADVLRRVGWPVHPRLLELLGRAYTWRGFFVACRNTGTDPAKLMAKQLEELKADWRIWP
jgi:hypothetical protein